MIDPTKLMCALLRHLHEGGKTDEFMDLLQRTFPEASEQEITDATMWMTGRAP